MKTIQIFNDITEQTLKQITDELIGVENGSEIRLQICSAGGLVFCAFGILDFLKAHKYNVISEIYGFAASAAALIALASNRVLMSEFGSIMIHSAYTETGGEDEGIRRANDLQLEIIRKRCPGFTEKDLSIDHWYSPAQALELGLCDEVISNADSILAVSKAICAKYSNHSISIEGVNAMEKEEKRVCSEMEQNDEVKQESVKAEDGAPSLEDVIERLVERLDVIEHRLAVLEGEGKKADDIAETGEEGVIAKRKALYAKLTAPKPLPESIKAKAEPRGTKLDPKVFKSFLD